MPPTNTSTAVDAAFVLSHYALLLGGCFYSAQHDASGWLVLSLGEQWRGGSLGTVNWPSAWLGELWGSYQFVNALEHAYL